MKDTNLYMEKRMKDQVEKNKETRLDVKGDSKEGRRTEDTLQDLYGHRPGKGCKGIKRIKSKE